MRDAGMPPRASVGGSGGAPGGGAGTHSDPTASAALWALESLPGVERELAACEEAVGEALEVVEGVRAAGMETWADVLEAYYVDGDPWDTIAGRMGVAERTCMRWRDATLDWVDMMGPAAKSGVGRAEQM